MECSGIPPMGTLPPVVEVEAEAVAARRYHRHCCSSKTSGANSVSSSLASRRRETGLSFSLPSKLTLPQSEIFSYFTLFPSLVPPVAPTPLQLIKPLQLLRTAPSAHQKHYIRFNLPLNTQQPISKRQTHCSPRNLLKSHNPLTYNINQPSNQRTRKKPKTAYQPGGQRG